MKLNPTWLFWKKFFELPVEILLMLAAGLVGVIILPLVLLYNLTLGRRDILYSVQVDIEREAERQLIRKEYPKKDPVVNDPRAHFELWADNVHGYRLGGVAYGPRDEQFVYNENETHCAWEGFQEGRVYEHTASIKKSLKTGLCRSNNYSDESR